jgi:D-sedoheptulose 7-phosphate isomerase
MEDLIRGRISESIEAKQRFLDEEENVEDIIKAVKIISDCFKNGNKVLICGNGGSAADAQHIAAEFVGKFWKLERKGLPAIALTTDSSNMTAWSNDYSFDTVFNRQLEALGNSGDVLIVLTTSDYNEEDNHSMNLKNALEKAKELSMKTIGLYSIKSEKILDLTDISIKANSRDTPRIQESHMLFYHIICELVEKELFDGEGKLKQEILGGSE